MHISRNFYFLVCCAATLFAIYVLAVGHFPLVVWVGIGVALIISWLFGLKSKRWKNESNNIRLE